MKYVVKEFAVMMDQTVEIRRSKLFDTVDEAQQYNRRHGRNDNCGYSRVVEVNDDGTDIPDEEYW